MTKLSPADLALITQRAALLEAEYVHRTRELHVEINDDDRNTLKMLSVFVALEKTLSRYEGVCPEQPSSLFGSPLNTD